MKEKIVNIYFNEPALPSTTMFHFMHSLRPFIMAEGPRVGEFVLIDINGGCAYTLDEILDDDDEFYGVAVIGEIW